MTSVLALISKSAYADLKTIEGWPMHQPGHITKIDRYTSKHTAFDTLAQGDAVFMVTVLPGEELWLVGILESPKRERGAWRSKPNTVETVNLTPVCELLGLERGDGKLAMRLQTPRVLDARHVAALRHIEAQIAAAHNKVDFEAKVPKRVLAGVSKPKPKAKPPKTMSAEQLAKAAAKLRKGTFAFVNARRLDADAIYALDKIHQKQFIEAMYMYAGDRQKTAKGALDAYLASQSWRPTDFSIALWDVIEGGRKRPRFEYWVQGAGDGTIFDYGKATSPGWIGSTQHSFEAHGAEDEETLALVDALQTAADKTL